MSDKLAAIASVSGTMNNVIYDNCNFTNSIPVLEIHGTADVVVLYLGLDDFGQFQDLMAIEDVVDFWVNYNNYILDQVVELEVLNLGDFSMVTRFSYTGGLNGSSVELYSVNAAGHT